jgi:AICAR transformylase/IMP cyclohydrolase PurH
MPNAIISVSDKSNLDILCPFLLEKSYTIYSTGGTYTYIKSIVNNNVNNNINNNVNNNVK